MDTNEQPQRPLDTTSGQQPTSEVYPPPCDPPSSSTYPPTTTMTSVTPPYIEAAPAQPGQGRMPRTQALDLLSRLKTTLIAGSVIAFGMFAALAAAHATGVTSRSSSSTQSSSGSGSQAAPTAPASDDGGFFNQTPSSGFGIGPPSSQAPVTGTSVS